MKLRLKLGWKIVLYAFLILVTIITLITLFYTVTASFKSNSEIASGVLNPFPASLGLMFKGEATLADLFDNYIQVFSGDGGWVGTKGNFLGYTFNSLFVSLLTAFIVVAMTSMSAYAFQRGDFPGKHILYWVFLGTMFIGAGTITLFPILRVTTKIGMNNLVGLAIVQAGTGGAANLFLTMGYLKTISKELDQAARIDGCSFFSTWYRIILPLSIPILGTIALMTFRGSWNSYLLPNLMLARSQTATTLVVAVVKLQSMGGAGASQYNLMMAGTMLAVAPMIILFIIMNRTFVEGITAGAVKE
ncbi:MAG: carbohydrate ABC transporter permease [Lachnospiraceae bacterium]|nr:carbohydrate ABC transporter permease [Lachnospiraceae bacterium]